MRVLQMEQSRLNFLAAAELRAALLHRGQFFAPLTLFFRRRGPFYRCGGDGVCDAANCCRGDMSSAAACCSGPGAHAPRAKLLLVVVVTVPEATTSLRLETARAALCQNRLP